MRALSVVSILLVAVCMGMSQWRNQIVTGLTIGTNNLARFESEMDGQGIHFIWWVQGGSLKYARLRSGDGAVYQSAVEIENPIGNYASVVTRNGAIYVAYEKSNAVKLAKSTDGGANWTIYSGQAMNNNSMNGLATRADGRGIHVVWSESNNETYYVRRDVGENTWVENATVTSGSEVGKEPSIALSQSKVHVGYNVPTSLLVKTRDYVWSTTTWEDPLTVNSGTLGSALQRCAVVGSNLHVLYQGWDSETETYGRLKHFYRAISGSSYTEPYPIC